MVEDNQFYFCDPWDNHIPVGNRHRRISNIIQRHKRGNGGQCRWLDLVQCRF